MLQNLAYKQTYGDNPVWKLYRRNHKGLYPPQKTRKLCIVSMQTYKIYVTSDTAFLIRLKFREPVWFVEILVPYVEMNILY